MANVGLSKPFYAKYSHDGEGNVSYSDGGSFGKAVNVDISLDNSEMSVLRADNSDAESMSAFTGGTMTLTLDELRLAVAAATMGIEVQESDEPKGQYVVFTAEDNAPYCGFGIVAKKIIARKTHWMAIVLYKVQMRAPQDSFTTQGKTIEFGTPQVTATILRDDTDKGRWRAWGMFASEADAVKYIKKELNITDPVALSAAAQKKAVEAK